MWLKLYMIEVMLVVENKLNMAKATDRGVICGGREPYSNFSMSIKLTNDNLGYHCRQYKPTADFIELVLAEAKERALAYAEAMCNDF